MHLQKAYPIVKNEFGWMFEPVKCWLHEHNVDLYADFVSSVTASTLFWPRLQTDPDAWYTVHVCLDYGTRILKEVILPLVLLGKYLSVNMVM